MLRKYVARKHVAGQEIDHIIGHHWAVYSKEFVTIIGILLLLYLVFFVLRRFSSVDNVSTLIAVVAMFVYVKGMVDFLNHYLDSMILTQRGVIVFKWEGLLEYKTDVFHWERIESVSHTQDSLADKVLQKGNIVVTLEHGVTYQFRDVPFPMKQANRILSTRDSYLLPSYDEDEEEQDKFHLLVETLGEVIQDYMGDRRKGSRISDHDLQGDDHLDRGMFG